MATQQMVCILIYKALVNNVLTIRKAISSNL